MTFGTATYSTQDSPSEETSLHTYSRADYFAPNNAKNTQSTKIKLDNYSILSAHIDKAEKHLQDGNYDDAYAELEAAAKRFISYKDKIQTSFNKSIAHLTTLGSRATPPHPKALPLTRLRREFTA